MRFSSRAQSQAYTHSQLRPSRRLFSLARAQASTEAASWDTLDDALAFVRKAQSVQKRDASSKVLEAMNELKEAGTIPKWGEAFDGTLSRRSIMVGELKQVGVKSPDQIAKPSNRNDAAFLSGVLGVSSLLAVVGLQLPGDWGFFVPYLTGGLAIATLAVGSTNPGLLTFAIDKFAQVFPDYRDRVLRHEAAHFLVGYLLGVPIVYYDLAIGREHTDFAEAAIQQRLFTSKLSEQDVDRLAVMAMAGIAAEATKWEEIVGQTADLLDLQRILNRSEDKLSSAAQQNATRWAVWQACSLLQKYSKEYSALLAAMANAETVTACVKAIENANYPYASGEY